MEQLIRLLLQTIEQAGFPAIRANPADRLPRISAPVVCIGVKQAKGSAAGFYDYLGTIDDPETGPQELYGRRVDCAMQLEVISPLSGGAQTAEDAASAVMQAAGALCGVRVGSLTLGSVRCDAENAVFRCPVTVELSAYFYAVETDDGESLTDFILKGDWK